MPRESSSKSSGYSCGGNYSTGDSSSCSSGGIEGSGKCTGYGGWATVNARESGTGNREFCWNDSCVNSSSTREYTGHRDHGGNNNSDSSGANSYAPNSTSLNYVNKEVDNKTKMINLVKTINLQPLQIEVKNLSSTSNQFNDKLENLKQTALTLRQATSFSAMETHNLNIISKQLQEKINGYKNIQKNKSCFEGFGGVPCSLSEIQLATSVSNQLNDVELDGTSIGNQISALITLETRKINFACCADHIYDNGQKKVSCPTDK